MATVTQLIPTLTGGISQQPDELKVPGQVNVADNVFPDVTHGLLKRPGGQFIKSLSDGTNNSVSNGRWFHYYRDETEQYIGQVSRTGDINMWRCSDGQEMTVTYTTSQATALTNYLTHSSDEDIQTLTVNDFTFLTNRTKTVAMASTVEQARPPEVFIELKTIKYASQYSLNLFDNTTTTSISTATRISVEQIKSSNNYCNSSGGMVTHPNRISETTRCDDTAGTGDDEQAPNVGTRIFDISSGASLVDEAAVSTRGGTDYSYTVSVHKKAFGGTYYHHNYGSTTVTVTTSTPHGLSVGTQMDFDILTGDGADEFATITSVPSSTTFTYQAAVANATSSAYSGNVNSSERNQTGRSNLYFRITSTGQSYPVDGTNYRTRYTVTNDLLYGGEGWQTGDFFYVYMKDAYYKVQIEEVSTSTVQANLGLLRPNPTSFDTKTTVTAQSILGAIRADIIATGNFTSANVQQIGNGLYITRASGSFNATTPNSSLINVVSGEVLTIEDLPKQCKHGMVVKVANTEITENDDYFVKFFGNNDRDGDGVWEECAKPGTQIEYDKATMPVQLVRTNATTFTLSQVDYEQANAGDTTATTGTNPRASFVGKTINKMVFFRNRLVMLSDEYIIMSRPGNFFNFWAKTAVTFSNIDVIDISVSSTYPAIVYDAIQVNAGLLVFTKNQQFLLTTDSDVLSPMTAKINALSNYNFNFKTNPISLGTTVGFLDNANKYSRFFEISNLLREGEPIVVEQSKVVSSLFDDDLKLISNSRENSIIFFSEEDTSTLYGYRYFQSGNERKMESWFSWTLTGTIRYHCMLDDALYVVVKNGTKDQLLKYSIQLDSSSHFVTSGVDFPVYLDHSMETSGWTYNATTNKSTKAKPTGLESTTAQLAAYDNSNNTSGVQNLGRYGKITVNGSNLELDGDWSGETFIIGYLFDMKVQIPTIYLKNQVGENYRSDTRCDLVIHRIKFNFGNVGVYTVTIDKQGKPTFTEEREVNQANLSTANNPNFLQGSFETIPCYERNKTLTVNVSSKHPTPATLLSYNWEGDYNQKNYKRV